MGVCVSKLKKFLNFKDFPMCKSALPRNSYLNIILNKDTKGVSNLYRDLHGRNYYIIEKVCDKWNKSENISLSTNEMSLHPVNEWS